MKALTYRQSIQVAIATITFGPGIAVAAAPANTELHIDAGPAKDTFAEFSDKTGYQFSFSSPDLVSSVNTHAFDGRKDPKLALKMMLKGTGLSALFIDAHTVLIFGRGTPIKSTSADAPEVLIRNSVSSVWSPMRGPRLTDQDLLLGAVNTVADVLRNFPWNRGGGGCFDDLINNSREAKTNSTFGCGGNLHGMGSASVLVLVDGRRVANGGTAGLFVDLSRIPMSAVARIEVTMDGSYILYGADAIAGVINIILKQNFRAIETRASWAPSTGGRVGERRFSQTAGGKANSASGFATVEYYHRDALAAADRKQGTSDLTPWGGSNHGTLFGTPANIVIGPEIWGVSDGGSATYIQGKPTLFDTRKLTDLIPEQSRLGGVLSGTLDVSPQLRILGKASITWRGVRDRSSAQGDALTIDSDYPFYRNPAGGTGPVTVLYGFLDVLGPNRLRNDVWNGDFDSTFSQELHNGWKIDYTAGYSFETQDEIVRGLYDPRVLSSLVAAGSFNPFGMNAASVLRSLESQSEFQSMFALGQGNIVAHGPFTVRMLGAINLTAGLEYRFETFSSRELAEPNASLVKGSSHRNVVSTFSQLCIPFTEAVDLACGGEHEALARLPQVTVGGRYENVQGFGGHVVPAVQLLWSPVTLLTLKANWSLSSKAPGLADLMRTDDLSQLTTLSDPSTSSATSSALLLSGGNPGLRRETATTWNLGAMLKPDIGEGLVMSLQYYSVDDRNRIDQPAIGSDVLTSPLARDLVTHNPTQEQQNTACQGTAFSGPGTDCTLVHADAIIDARLHNVTRLKTNGLDLNLEQSVDSRFLSSLGLIGNYILKYDTSGLSGAAKLVSSPGYPDQFSARAFARLDRGPIEAQVSVAYENGYHDYVNQPNRNVASFTTVDWHFRWRFGTEESPQSCISDVSLDVENLFNTAPPFVNMSAGIGFDTTNASIRGRFVTLGVRKCW